MAKEDGYNLMPGGLTRSAVNKDDFLVSSQSSAISKDTWIISGDNHNQKYTEETIKSNFFAGNYTSSLPSRLAENLFWLGRYAERTEGSINNYLDFINKDSDELLTTPDIALLSLMLWR